MKWFQKAAEQGNADAQRLLGLCYYTGDGVEKDLSEAVKWTRKAAEQGNAKAQGDLGFCYYTGNGVEKDLSEAVKWFQKAAEQGNADAQRLLGLCYYTGDGVEKDLSEAVKWTRKAAEQGNAKAQGDLGFCYYTGNGVEKDLSEAVKWFQKAAEQGNAEAQYLLGRCYYIGKGVPVDRDEAKRWYQKTAEQGLKDAKKILSGIDFSVPKNAHDADDTFVLVIANEDYSKAEVESVRYAESDGERFAEYAKKTLGVPTRNIKLVTNATAGEMRSAERWLRLRVKQVPEAKVIYYYAGHGVPVVSNGRIEKTCLLPTDVSVADAEDAGIETQELFERLSQLEAKQVAVFLDTCFSGMTRDDKPQFAARGVRLKAKSTAPRGNMVVFSAASGDQTALPSKGAPHGIFTSKLLLALQQSKGEVSYGELAKFLKKEVPLAALNIHDREQTPTVEVSGDFDMDQKLVE